MNRGRSPVPPEIQALKGNPRKRGKKALMGNQAALPPPILAGAPADQPAPEVLPPEAAPSMADVVYPEFLTHDREKQIFKLIVDEFLPRNLVRVTDFNAVGRYSTYMHMWIEAKEQLEASGGSNWYKTKSKHGEMLRRHPAFQDMLDLGHELRQAEPQLALTPLARNAIMQRFMRGGVDQSLFSPGGADDDQPRRDEPPTAPVPVSALGSLRRAATPIDKLN